MRGKIKMFNPERGFGFITPADGGADVFFHVSQCSAGDNVASGDNVSFEIETDGRTGKLRAADVEPA